MATDRSCFSLRVRSAMISSWRATLFSLCFLSGVPAVAQDKWVPLFNHRDLSGWKEVGAGRFVVEDGMLKSEGGPGLLCYAKGKLGNVVLRLEFKRVQVKADSGVYIRMPEMPTVAFTDLGHEVEIGDWPEDYSVTGALYRVNDAMARPEKPFGEWNQLEITLDGPRTVVFLNGTKVTDYTEGQPFVKSGDGGPAPGRRPDEGFIGLQNYNAASTVLFREVLMKPIGKHLEQPKP